MCFGTRGRQKKFEREVLALLHEILKRTPNRILGGRITQIGDSMSSPVLVPIQPGQTPVFKVSPTFSGDPFTLDGSKASITSSDPTNFPVELDLVSDPQGTTFKALIPTSAVIAGGSEAITVEWDYANPDGTVGKVTGTVTELGITDDVTGGTFAQVA